MSSETVLPNVQQLQESGVLRVEDGNHGEYRPRRDEFTDTGVAFIRAADVRDGTVDFEGADQINDTAVARIRKGIGKPADLILTHKGTVGRVARVPSDAPPFVCSPQTTFWRVLDSSRLDPDFLFAFLRSPTFVRQLRQRQNDTDMAPYVSLTAQREIEVPLPSLARQQAAGSITRVMDDKIDSNRRFAGLLEKAAETLFRARFHQFVGAEELEESEIGQIPKGWSVGSIYEVADVTYGRPFKSALFDAKDGVPLIRIRDLPASEPSVRTPEEREDGRLIQRGDIVVGMDGEFRAYAWAGPDSWLNQRVCAFDPRDGISRTFVLEAIRPALRHFEATKSGTTVIHLGKRDIDTFRVVIPPSPVMRQFATEADPLLSLAVALRFECRALISVRDALLPKLISGEILVPDTADPDEVVGVAAERAVA